MKVSEISCKVLELCEIGKSVKDKMVIEFILVIAKRLDKKMSQLLCSSIFTASFKIDL